MRVARVFSFCRPTEIDALQPNVTFFLQFSYFLKRKQPREQRKFCGGERTGAFSESPRFHRPNADRETREDYQHEQVRNLLAVQSGFRFAF